MKKKILILLAAVVAIGAPVLAPQAKAIDFQIAVGDRPYYHGQGYWHQGYHWVWVPGYHRHGHWVQGHYVRRGGYNSHYSRTHFQHHRVWVETR